MAWIVTDDARVLASAEIATNRGERRRGLLGRTGIDGAIVIEKCRWVHTVGMKFAIDVAYLDADNRVIKVTTMAPNRIGAPVRHATHVIEAESGAFDRWGLIPHITVEVREGT